MRKPWESFSAVDDFFDPLLKSATRRWVLLLPAVNLCHWYLKCGGCTMCGFNSKTSSKQQFSWVAKYLSQRSLHCLYWFGYWGIRKQKPENLTIYNGGNFLNGGSTMAKTEIPFKLQKSICRHVGQHPSISKLFVESRPEFVEEANIQELTQLLDKKTLEVGIGLESVNEKVRNGILHKGMDIRQFETAITTLKKNRAQSLAYVFLKPMRLSEAEAIKDAIDTIRYCFKIGVDEVSLSCAFIQDGTRMADMYKRSEYRLPWLWSIIEVIKKTAHLGPVRIGTFEDDPPPLDVPHNCFACTNRIRDVISKYRQTFNLSLFDSLDCSCKKEWINNLQAR